MFVIDKLRQYGGVNFIKRSFFAVLNRLGVRYNKWLVCKQNINIDLKHEKLLDDKFSVKEMSYYDFYNSSMFTKIKLEKINQRLKSSNLFAYGVFCNNQLAYYCWISLSEFQFSNSDYKMCLNKNEGLLFDAYCFPKYRGNKLHSFMNTHRLKMLLQFNKSNALVILLNENIPARRAQRRAGFTCDLTLITGSLFGYKWNKLHKKTIRL